MLNYITETPKGHHWLQKHVTEPLSTKIVQKL